MSVKVGVYICHCGTNISGKVNVTEVTDFSRALPDVAIARDYKFMCSDPGQILIQDDIKNLGLERIVVSEPLWRSLNRVNVDALLARGYFVLSLKPWYRIPEKAEEDDNPDIDEYLGYGEVRTLYTLKKNVFGLMLRNNLRSHGNRGAVQIDWSFPVLPNLKGYVQYFNGYGESLADYNHAVNRIGFGVMFTDWL